MRVIIELRKRRAAEKEGTLYLRISVGGKKPYERESLGITLPERLWDADEQRIMKGYPNQDALNRQISERKHEVEDQIKTLIKSKRALTNLSAQKILAGSSGGDVIEYWQTYLEYLKHPRKTRNGTGQKFAPGYIVKMEKDCERLSDYTNGQLSFSDIDKSWLEGYEVELAKSLKAESTLPSTFVRLFTVLNRAESEGLFNRSQIQGFELPPYRDSAKDHLTLEQTDQIWAEIEKGSFSKAPELLSVAAYFLIECYCGIRFSDWGRYKIEKLIEKESLKVRAKKNGEPVYFPLTKSPRLLKVVNLIRDQNIPAPKNNSVTNKLLKVIGGLANIPFPLTTHTGRHTLAIFLLELGYSDATIAEFMGISERTVKTYAKTTRRKISNEYDKYGGV